MPSDNENRLSAPDKSPASNLGVLSAILCVVCAGVMLAAMVGVAFTRHDVTHTEGEMIWAVMRVAQGGNLYADWHQWPHRFHPYGPVFAEPIGLLLRMFGWTNFGFFAYGLGRAQSILYIAGCAILVGAVLRKLGFSWRWGLAFGLCVPVWWPDIILPLVSFRPDFPALFWCLAAVAVGLAHPKRTRNRVLCALLYLISFAAKPTLVAFPVAFAVMLFFFVSYKVAIRWALGLFTLLILWIAGATYFTDGRFWMNVVTGSGMGWTTGNLKLIWHLLTHFDDVGLSLTLWTVYIRFVVAGVLAAALVIKRANAAGFFVGLYYLLSLALAHAGMLKVGAALHYVLEPYFVSWLVFGAGFHWYWRVEPVWQRQRRLAFVAIGVVLFAVPLLYNGERMAVRAWVGFRDLKKPTPYDALMNLPDDAWLGDLAFTHPGEDVHAICDPVWYGTMTAAGKVDKTPLLKRLDSGEFSIIALSPASQFLFFGAGSTWVGDAIKRHYHIDVEIPEYQLWERDTSDVAAR